jgi:hypothetical protein
MLILGESRSMLRWSPGDFYTGAGWALPSVRLGAAARRVPDVAVSMQVG